MKKISKSIGDTQKIAQDFLNKIKKNKNTKAVVVGLYGNLGAGKTAFTKMFAQALGVKRKVNSPTFVIMKSYALKNKIFKKLIHLDAYRLKNEKELLHLGWNEIISNKEHLVFIEWPENVKKTMPKKHHKIKISHLPDGKAGTKNGGRSFDIKML